MRGYFLLYRVVKDNQTKMKLATKMFYARICLRVFVLAAITRAISSEADKTKGNQDVLHDSYFTRKTQFM